MASNVSELMPDKVSFGYGFPCDGPGRGGTCDISAFDGLYLAIFWMLNMLWPASWVCVWSGDELCGSVAGVFGGSVSMRLGYCQTIPMAPMMYPRWTSTVCTRRTRPRFWHPTCSPRVLCVRTALLVLRMMYPPACTYGLWWICHTHLQYFSVGRSIRSPASGLLEITLFSRCL